MYYNTNNETGKTLENSEKKTETQEQEIYAFFVANPGIKASPSQIATIVFNDKIPLTSARRGITDLTTKGLLDKTLHMVDGRYGKQEHTWAQRRQRDKTADTTDAPDCN